jgi:hypothetical protein
MKITAAPENRKNRARSLDTLAKRIRANHDLFSRSVRNAVQRAWLIGRDLVAVKDLLDHGDYLPWIEKHCEFSERSAQLYTRLFRRHPHGPPKNATVALLTLGKLDNETEKAEPAERDSFWWLSRETRRFIKLIDKWMPQIERSMRTGDFSDFWAQSERLRNTLTSLIERREQMIGRWLKRAPTGEMRTRAEKLRDLIIHPSTPETEREVAKRKLVKFVGSDARSLRLVRPQR